MKNSPVRRALVAVLMTLPLLAATACGGGFSGGSGGGGKVTVVGQKFTEADIMTELYKQLLEKAGFSVDVKNLGTRDIYLKPLEKGSVQISADYLSSMTEALNKTANGENAAPVASADEQATLGKLTDLGKKYGITPLQPAKAEDANAFFVTKKFAQQHQLTTLSDLGKLGQPIKVAAAPDCGTRHECALGLKDVYGIKITKVEPLGFGSADTKDAVTKGEVQLGETGTTDGTLASQGLVILQDDKGLENAENLVPIVNSAWLKKHPKAKTALDKLSSVLTTADLSTMNKKVDAERQQASDVAKAYLKSKGLV
jgi:osmoprotectant transport system substrate-binding protein